MGERIKVVDINLDLTTIGSFGFLVLETTDLPHRSTPAITEFCMIACSPKDLLELKDDVDVPRVSHKLTMCFDPNKRIHPEATEKSGLTREMLTNQNEFDEKAANVIKHFIAFLPKPLCLVAHNGNRFQFKILKRELNNFGVNLPDDVLCTDSLNVFRKLDKVERLDKLDKLDKLDELESFNLQKSFPISPTKLGKRLSFKLGDIYERRVFKMSKYDDQEEIEPLKVVKILKIASSYRELFNECALDYAKFFSEIKTFE